MRYSFHGKVRATGQQVDGYVEAETSTDAIDRLADQGIIGVYSVRAEPKGPRNPVLLAGTPEFERAQFEEAANVARRSRKAPPAPSHPTLPVAPAPVPLPAVAMAPVAVAAPAGPTSGVSDAVMTQLVDKLSMLIVQVQKLLDRPAQVVYASSGPAREGGGGKGGKRPGRAVSDSQNSTLKDIFQNNLDLRRSLQKLAETVTPEVPATNGTAAAAGAPPVVEAKATEAPAPTGPAADEEPPPPPHGGSSVHAFEVPEADPVPTAEAGADDLDEGMPLRVHDSDRGRQAQPAA